MSLFLWHWVVGIHDIHKWTRKLTLPVNCTVSVNSINSYSPMVNMMFSSNLGEVEMDSLWLCLGDPFKNISNLFLALCKVPLHFAVEARYGLIQQLPTRFLTGSFLRYSRYFRLFHHGFEVSWFVYQLLNCFILMGF